ncbi:MAG TPA: asparagine synthase (glutamine-hydrolyzing) [Desulfomonilaceae bacterium]|nr:asparagine synthase (glutamine-hydrolyzing) [Desulfomonilaceae bacterium]
MCGIFALINPSGRKIDLHACRCGVDLQKHRGPDGSGEWISESEEVFLGHRRLSILDLSEAGGQPMVSDAGNVLIYNGEIYNFRSLRQELESRGCRFKSTCDTEVLLHALETWGTDCLEKLEGMFAFLFWRPDLEEALIVRDFFGIKPLYFWAIPEGGLAVSSEIKSFYALPGFTARLNCELLPEFLAFRSVSGEETLLKEVREVNPGQLLRYRKMSDTVQRSAYWDVASAVSRSTFSGKQGHDEFLSIFTDTVERHLIADVPVGTQFSGGVDSSLISALVIKGLGRDLKGFHCRVEAADYDEMPLAAQIGRFLGMEVEYCALDSKIFFSGLLEKLTWHHDEPLTHPNSVGIYLLSELAREQVTVLLSGEAADEFFGGYSRYPLLLLHGILQDWPALLGSFEWVSGFMPHVTGRFGVLKKFFKKARYMSLEDRIVSGTGFMEDWELQRITGDAEAYQQSIHRRTLFLGDHGTSDMLTRCQLFDIQTYLPALFVRQDKMSMAASIENRVPFATPRILSLAMQLPGESRATTMKRKSFLKSCLNLYIPKRLANRRKVGFGLPLGVWLARPEGRERLRSLTSADSPLHGIVDTKSVESLVTSFRGEAPQANTLWTLLSLKVWMDVFCKNKPAFVRTEPGRCSAEHAQRYGS